MAWKWLGSDPQPQNTPKHFPRTFYHMLPEDVEIWTRFLKLFADQWDRFDYDVLCGPPLDITHLDLDPNMRQLAERLFALRIDVIAYRPGEAWIIEVKPNAGLSALGQLLAYHYYMAPRLTDHLRVELMIVTDYLRHYMRPVLDHFGIWTVVVHDEPEKPPELYAPKDKINQPPPVKVEGGARAYT